MENGELMRLTTFTMVLLLAACWSGAALATPKADAKKAHTVMQQKCTSCHGQDKIDAALKAGKDLTVIQKEMERKGARLNANERDVLGIYWSQNPLKQKK